MLIRIPACHLVTTDETGSSPVHNAEAVSQKTWHFFCDFLQPC